MKIRAPPGREESMERTKDFYNGMNYAKKQLQQREHERRRRKRYFIKQKLCGIAVLVVLGIVTPFAPLLDLDIITISAFFMPIALGFIFSKDMWLMDAYYWEVQERKEKCKYERDVHKKSRQRKAV